MSGVSHLSASPSLFLVSYQSRYFYALKRHIFRR